MLRHLHQLVLCGVAVTLTYAESMPVKDSGSATNAPSKCPASPPSPAAAPDAPNFVFVLTDDLDETLGSVDHALNFTLDYFRTNGATADNWYVRFCSSSTCSTTVQNSPYNTTFRILKLHGCGCGAFAVCHGWLGSFTHQCVVLPAQNY